MSNYQHKTAQNFTTATHANTMLGQLHIRNTASALCLYIPFHKKEKLSLTPEADKQLRRKYCTPMCHNQHTHTRIHYSQTSMLYTSTQRHTHHLQDFQLIPCLHLNFYIFLFVILKNTGCSAKIISLPSFPILCPSHPLFYLHVFKGCLSQIQNNSSYAPTTSKAHFKIENSYKHLYF